MKKYEKVQENVEEKVVKSTTTMMFTATSPSEHSLEFVVTRHYTQKIQNMPVEFWRKRRRLKDDAWDSFERRTWYDDFMNYSIQHTRLSVHGPRQFPLRSTLKEMQHIHFKNLGIDTSVLPTTHGLQ